jgi:hypothetical protein
MKRSSNRATSQLRRLFGIGAPPPDDISLILDLLDLLDPRVAPKMMLSAARRRSERTIVGGCGIFRREA